MQKFFLPLLNLLYDYYITTYILICQLVFY
nr:MAG TPA: hypothetical protein [Caudoviricetes sp.]